MRILVLFLDTEWKKKNLCSVLLLTLLYFYSWQKYFSLSLLLFTCTLYIYTLLRRWQFVHTNTIGRKCGDCVLHSNRNKVWWFFWNKIGGIFLGYKKMTGRPSTFKWINLICDVNHFETCNRRKVKWVQSNTHYHNTITWST